MVRTLKVERVVPDGVYYADPLGWNDRERLKEIQELIKELGLALECQPMPGFAEAEPPLGEIVLLLRGHRFTADEIGRALVREAERRRASPAGRHTQEVLVCAQVILEVPATGCKVALPRQDMYLTVPAA